MFRCGLSRMENMVENICRKTDMLKLSIITIAYNNLAGLRKTAESVLAQTQRDFEWIIVDGASTDGTQEYLPEIRLQWQGKQNDLQIISEPDSGIYNAMNKGIRLAHGEYLLFLNSGDCLSSQRMLEELMLLDCRADILYGNCIQIWPNGYTQSTNYPHNVTGLTLFEGTLPHQASLIKRSLFYKIGLYSEDLFFGADWEFYLKALFYYNCSFCFIDKYVCLFDMTGISTNATLNQQMQEERQVVLQRTIPQLSSDYKALVCYKKQVDSTDIKALRIGKSILKPIRKIIYLFRKR